MKATVRNTTNQALITIEHSDVSVVAGELIKMTGVDPTEEVYVAPGFSFTQQSRLEGNLVRMPYTEFKNLLIWVER